jgi:hypothetical protein
MDKLAGNFTQLAPQLGAKTAQEPSGLRPRTCGWNAGAQRAGVQLGEQAMQDTPPNADMQAELERLRAENARLKREDKGGLRLKVSGKGAVSIYGLGRFPVTLYQEQWLRLLGIEQDIRAFIDEHRSELKAKE